MISVLFLKLPQIPQISADLRNMKLVAHEPFMRGDISNEQ